VSIIEDHQEEQMERRRRSRRDPEEASTATEVKENIKVVKDLGMMMEVDTGEDLWTRLHDIRINSSVLEYVGRGEGLEDNGLAQSSIPLNPLNHYYQVRIVDAGQNCYIAVGLARKDYPAHRHPGWTRGSIAFHADDGKIFIGSGIGSPFGPKCALNDTLGCGIVFPLKYSDPPPGKRKKRWPWEGGEEKGGRESYPRRRPNRMDNAQQDQSSESEDDIWWNNRNQVYEDKVKVFFMRNGKLLGIKEVRIPKGGFYPTIGMMSSNEKVLVDLNPLSG